MRLSSQLFGGQGCLISREPATSDAFPLHQSANQPTIHETSKDRGLPATNCHYYPAFYDVYLNGKVNNYAIIVRYLKVCKALVRRLIYTFERAEARLDKYSGIHTSPTSLHLFLQKMSSVKSYGAISEADIQFGEVKKPSYREPHTMDPRTWLRDLSPYFLYLMAISTMGPLLFGFHLVSLLSRRAAEALLTAAG